MTTLRAAFKSFLEELPIVEIAKKIKSADEGQRLWPSQTTKNDNKFNFRADRGSKSKRWNSCYEIIFQANENADNKGGLENAATDNYRIIAKAVVNTGVVIDITEDALDSFDETNV
ncbi:hypothetical protein K491DRAFT_742109 [Lophiostoma macrostomum CBS 122681]|uniref:Uncharacterized protein n=1 Tax=Lophiostoma macrostomum CBS 122681 TaxID=1314788 RepID=A0A6A6TBW7_9PLEO|nr:hypothetical protein K491DRAFT_742109 [Lophiostoma macrostomum CBS 122681]